MTIDREKNKQSGQMEPVLKAESTDSAQKRRGSLEKRVLSSKPLPTNNAASSSKGGTGRHWGPGRDSYHPATNYHNNYYPGYSGANGLRNGKSSMAPEPSYGPFGNQPSGLSKFYGPSGISPPIRFPKQSQFQNSRPMVQNTKGRILDGNSGSNLRDKSTRKGDYGTSNELTCASRVDKSFRKVDYKTSDELTFAPRVHNFWDKSTSKVDHETSDELRRGPRVDKSSRKVDYKTSEELTFAPRVNNFWDKSTSKVDYETSDDLSRGPRVNKRNDSVVSKFDGAEFQIEYKMAKFYVIKSYSEDDVHKCIKYDVWSSTPNGNEKLDAAFHDAEAKVREFGKCPVFLFFSVNASGQFVGLAEMIGKVDYNKTMDFWQADRWSGFFPVKWHIIKDIPNPRLRHILLENNENKPVTFTRDTHEIGLKQGLEMLKIFKNYQARTSVLDDDEFYEDREKTILARKNSKPAAHQTDVYKYNDDLFSNYSDAKVMDRNRSARTNSVSGPTSLLVDLAKNLSIN